MPEAPAILVLVPVKPFGIAKARLSPVLGAGSRRRLGQAILAHTLDAARRAGGTAAVVTSDQGVARWADRRRVRVIEEDPEFGAGLDGAARSGVVAARRLRLPWAILHADLPLLEAADLEPLFTASVEAGLAIAPSHDRGTNAIGGTLHDFPFSFGPDSFGRHLGAAVRLHVGPTILVRRALALDLDGPEDLAAIRRLARGSWVAEIIG